MNAITAIFCAALVGLAFWVLLILAFWHPVILIGGAGAVGVGSGWAVIAFIRREDR